MCDLPDRRKNVLTHGGKHQKNVLFLPCNIQKNVLYCNRILEKGGDFLKRKAIADLVRWKSSEDRKPLVLKGARQVGKTWLMKEFGESCYDHYVYFNFDEEDELKSIFETNKNRGVLLSSYL